jgi:hypothetical protein
MMLRHPATGAARRCTAKKRWALVRIMESAPSTGEPRMDVVFRTSDPDALRTRAHREANKASPGNTIAVFRLTDGQYLGPVSPT